MYRIWTTIEIIPNLMGAAYRPTGSRGAFLWLRTGGNVSTIAELMGHSNISTTSIYLHASPTTMRAAVERLRWGAERDPDGDRW